MKFFLLLIVLFVNAAFAQQDAVAFFYKPDRVAVLIQERLNDGTRISDFIEHVTTERYFETTSVDGSIRIGCLKRVIGADCVLNFIPSHSVKFMDRAIVVSTTLEDLGLPNVGAFNMSFAGSMKDKFKLEIKEDGTVRMEGSKK